MKMVRELDCHGWPRYVLIAARVVVVGCHGTHLEDEALEHDGAGA
jgi:hypothetical protein